MSSISKEIFDPEETQIHDESKLDTYLSSKVFNLSKKWNIEKFDVKKFCFTPCYKSMLIFVDKKLNYNFQIGQIEEALQELEDPRHIEEERERFLQFINARSDYYEMIYLLDLELVLTNKLQLAIDGELSDSCLAWNFDGSVVINIESKSETIKKENSAHVYLYKSKKEDTIFHFPVKSKVENKIKITELTHPITRIAIISNEFEYEDKPQITIAAADSEGYVMIYHLPTDLESIKVEQKLTPKHRFNLREDRVASEENEYLKQLISDKIFACQMKSNYGMDQLMILTNENEVMIYSIPKDLETLKFMNHTRSLYNIQDWSLTVDGSSLLLAGHMLESIQSWDLKTLLANSLPKDYQFSDIENAYQDFYMVDKPKEKKTIQNTFKSDSEFDPNFKKRLDIYRAGSIPNYIKINEMNRLTRLKLLDHQQQGMQQEQEKMKRMLENVDDSESSDYENSDESYKSSEGEENFGDSKVDEVNFQSDDSYVSSGDDTMF